MNNLIESVKRGKSAHAYIFCGKKGMYRHSCARLFANALVCESSDIIPCTKCKPCTLAKASTNTDIIYLTKENDSSAIKVDSIRELNENAFVKPFVSKKKIFIIDGNYLNTQGQNALLKTLEEPPEYAVFIIIVSDLNNLLPTILSRCTKIDFLQISDNKIKTFLKEKYPDYRGNIDFCVSFAMGCPGKAESIIKDEEFMNLRENCVNIMQKILSQNTLDSYKVSEFFENNKDRTSDILDILLLFFRDMLMIYSEQKHRIVNSDFVKELSFYSTTTQPESMLSIIDLIITSNKMEQNHISAKYIGMYFSLSVKRILSGGIIM